MSGKYDSKLVIVGDGAVGKTCLLDRLQDVTPDFEGPVTEDTLGDYEPTTFNSKTVEWETEDGACLTMELWDTAGQEGFEALRKLSYPGTEIYIVAYQTTSEITLTNIEHKWIPEIMASAESTDSPWIVICGTKVDLRVEGAPNSVSTEAGAALAEKVGAFFFIETSAKSGIGVQALEEAIIKAAIKKAKGGVLELWTAEVIAEEVEKTAGKKTVTEDNMYETPAPPPTAPKPATSESSAPPAGTKQDEGCCVVS